MVGICATMAFAFLLSLVFEARSETDPGVRLAEVEGAEALPSLTYYDRIRWKQALSRFEETGSVFSEDGGSLRVSARTRACLECHQSGSGPERKAPPPQAFLAFPLAGAFFFAKEAGTREVRDGAHRCSFHRLKEAGYLGEHPEPLLGVGLLEALPESKLVSRFFAVESGARALGIRGRLSRLPDGKLGRFGRKAQAASLLPSLFVADGLLLNGDETEWMWMVRQLAPPRPSAYASVEARGRRQFESVGCVHCHRGEPVEENAIPFTDFALHRLGARLAAPTPSDTAAPDEFKTAPLWGLGFRPAFLHDGRTRDLKEAIELHFSHPDRGFAPSEANEVIERYRRLPPWEKQALLDFLRSL